MSRGRLIAFEGGEACGKSTQAARLAADRGAVLTREPGGTALGEQVRAWLLDPATAGLDARAEALLMAAARAQHVAEVIEPALAAGRDVVTDRYVGSSLAYQGAGRGLRSAELAALSRFAGAPEPDVVVLLDVPDAVAVTRRSGRAPDRIEGEDASFHRRVVEGFRALAAAPSGEGYGRWVVVDGDATVDAVAERVAAAVDAALAGSALMALFDEVVGQRAAVRQLEAAAHAPVHAYLLVGPPGVGKRVAARHFAAALLCPHGGDGTCDVCRRTLAGTHPDALVFERSGASILRRDVDEIIRVAVRTPMEAGRKVLTLVDLHLVPEAQAPRLLKTIEEPPLSTIFVILADTVLPHFVTIASRCVRIDFGLLGDADLVGALVAAGVAKEVADAVAPASGGRLDRALLLAGDQGFAARREAWRSLADRLDGKGATVARLVDELAGLVEPLMVPLRARQQAELDAAAKAAEVRGERFLKGDAKELADQHKREERRLRIDELKAGLSTLTGAYRERLARPEPAVQRHAIAAVEAIAKANELLERNPNETLLVQNLFLHLGAPR